MADTAAAPAPAPTRPTKPDEALFKENLAKAEKEHEQVMTQLVCHASIPSAFVFVVALLHEARSPGPKAQGPACGTP